LGAGEQKKVRATTKLRPADYASDATTGDGNRFTVRVANYRDKRLLTTNRTDTASV
jgi:hypothetical protein